MPQTPPTTFPPRGVTRRAIVAGTAWATPAILGVSSLPAFAASGYKYYLASSGQLYFGTDQYGYLTGMDVSNDVNGVASDGNIMPRGFNVVYLPNQGKQTTAFLDGSLYYYVIIPTGLVRTFSFTSGSTTWRLASVLRNVKQVTVGQSTTLNLSYYSYDVFKYQFIGSSTGTTASLSTRTAPASWSGSVFSLTASAAGSSPYWYDNSMPYYTGAVASFHTADGFSTKDASSIAMRWTS